MGLKNDSDSENYNILEGDNDLSVSKEVYGMSMKSEGMGNLVESDREVITNKNVYLPEKKSSKLDSSPSKQGPNIRYEEKKNNLYAVDDNEDYNDFVDDEIGEDI